jgi:hypothetical protein
MRNCKRQFIAFLFLLSGLTAYSQTSPVTVEVKPLQTEIREGEELSVSTVLRNTGTEAQTMRRDACGYGDLWFSDNKSIQIAPSACLKPGFMGVTLEPDEAFRADVQVYAKLAPSVGEGEWITFRLGFKSEFRSEKDPPQPNLKPQTLWSNAVTVKVTRASASSR